MFDWEFGDPWFLVLLVLRRWSIWLATRPTSLLGFLFASLFAQHLPIAGASVCRCLPALLLDAAHSSLLVVALARPRTPQRETRSSRDGIAIMMVVDLSSSMDARDMVEEDRSINRLDVVKDVFVDFVLGTRSHRRARDGRTTWSAWSRLPATPTASAR